jgi:hypothetical protein
MGSQSLPTGLLSPWSGWGKYNQMAFAIQQLISKIQTATLVKIVSCTNDGGLSPVGYVNVIPLVNQLDQNGNPVPHVTIYNVPYLRMQGGANAIILDPQGESAPGAGDGDIGVAVFASRDISKVKSTQAQANPGSARQYDFSDGLYLGGMLNGVPSQYISFDPVNGITINSPIGVNTSNEGAVGTNIVDYGGQGVFILEVSSAGAPLLLYSSQGEIFGVAPSIQLSNGGTVNPLMTKNFLDFWNTNIFPFLQGLGYTGPNPPSDSVTTVLEGQ